MAAARNHRRYSANVDATQQEVDTEREEGRRVKHRRTQAKGAPCGIAVQCLATAGTLGVLNSSVKGASWLPVSV